MSSGKSLSLLLVLFVFLEICLLSHTTHTNWVPHLAFVLLIYIGIANGYWVGFLNGALAGLFFSFTSDGPPLYFIASYGFIGYISGLIRGFVFIESPLAQCVVPACGYLIIQFLNCIFLYGTNPNLGWEGYFLSLQSSALLTTVLSAPIMYLFLHQVLRSHK